MTIVICQGQTSRKLVSSTSHLADGSFYNVTPFIGVTSQGELGHLGVGIQSANEEGRETSRLNGIYFPRNLLQSWHAMRLLEEVSELTSGSLHQIWRSAGAEGISADDLVPSRSFEHSDQTQLRVLRDRVLTTMPSDKELAPMLTVVLDNAVRLTDLAALRELAEERAYRSSLPLVGALETKEIARLRELDLPVRPTMQMPLPKFATLEPTSSSK